MNFKIGDKVRLKRDKGQGCEYVVVSFDKILDYPFKLRNAEDQNELLNEPFKDSELDLVKSAKEATKFKVGDHVEFFIHERKTKGKVILVCQEDRDCKVAFNSYGLDRKFWFPFDKLNHLHDDDTPLEETPVESSKEDKNNYLPAEMSKPEIDLSQYEEITGPFTGKIKAGDLVQFPKVDDDVVFEMFDHSGYSIADEMKPLFNGNTFNEIKDVNGDTDIFHIKKTHFPFGFEPTWVKSALRKKEEQNQTPEVKPTDYQQAIDYLAKHVKENDDFKDVVTDLLEAMDK